MTQNLTLAIIGCGMIGTVHANVVNAHPSLSVAALVDIDDNAAHKLADRIEQEHGAARPAIFRTLEDALAATDIDVVAVCTPSGVHVSNATAALNADKHLIVEKPLDVSVEQGVALEALAVAARERGVTSTVISQHRFDPEAIAVHNAVSAGRFGRLTSAVASIAWWRSQGYYDSGAWRGTWAMDGGGALMNQGVHTVDLLLWMMGRP
ncbi:MAG: Gfo/Idh/MocA family oxidoreductase, partial [Microbacteriaceae bacterium]|nr:Gfo/Idh/MocA family oxidoreductase [Microbacteriaceae bacterium]